MKYNNKPSELYRSGLERTCIKLLEEHKVPYSYEKTVFTLIDGFVFNSDSYERIGIKKEFKRQRENILPIRYTPDFMGEYNGKKWIIETKGMRTEAFNHKWKLFKKYLTDNSLEYLLFLPSNTKEIIHSIKTIKSDDSSNTTQKQDQINDPGLQRDKGPKLPRKSKSTKVP